MEREITIKDLKNHLSNRTDMWLIDYLEQLENRIVKLEKNG